MKMATKIRIREGAGGWHVYATEWPFPSELIEFKDPRHARLKAVLDLLEYIDPHNHFKELSKEEFEGLVGGGDENPPI